MTPEQLARVSPAPWRKNEYDGEWCHWCVLDADSGVVVKGDEDDMEFIALARNAFDVLLRRGDTLLIERTPDGQWMIDSTEHGWIPGKYADPFTALVEADAWLKSREGT